MEKEKENQEMSSKLEALKNSQTIEKINEVKEEDLHTGSNLEESRLGHSQNKIDELN